MFFKTIVAKNFAILTGKHLCWSLFLIKNISISTLSQTRPQHRWFLDPEEIVEIFTNSFFYGTFPVAAFVSLIKSCSMMGIC